MLLLHIGRIMSIVTYNNYTERCNKYTERTYGSEFGVTLL